MKNTRDIIVIYTEDVNEEPQAELIDLDSGLVHHVTVNTYAEGVGLTAYTKQGDREAWCYYAEAAESFARQLIEFLPLSQRLKFQNFVRLYNPKFGERGS